MRFAVNYSTKLAELIKAGKLDCDLFKCPEWDGLLKAASAVKPVYLHLDINVGRDEIRQLDFEKLRNMLAETGSPHVNCHLSGTQNLKVGSKADRTKLLKLWIKEIEVLKKEFEGYPVISENLPFEPLIPEYQIACDPDLISSAIIETDTGLLLDISHARITSETLRVDYQSYIEKLPLHRLREVHITGLRMYHGFLEDHFEMQPADWASTEWASEQINSGMWRKPEIVAFEYGGVGEWFSWRTETWALEDQVPKLARLFSEG
ncbi:MAG: DUF692 family protein [Anaerolineaceae bacterium]|nr:DUF692 family protein [Anaerolineaceae bacterium]